MRVADLDELYKVMQEELGEMAIGDEFKAGFMYAMGIVKRERGIKIPKAKPENLPHISVVPLVGSKEQD
jgi:hypothetical protein